SQSMILLPKVPMQPRLADPRVGYFSLDQVDYGLDEPKAARRTYVQRWRLEPKDPEAFARGELVEPVKPIVYYIDPATPEKWRASRTPSWRKTGLRPRRIRTGAPRTCATRSSATSPTRSRTRRGRASTTRARARSWSPTSSGTTTSCSSCAAST